MNVYLNDEDVRVLDGLDTSVGERDVLVILPAMAGGSRRSVQPIREFVRAPHVACALDSVRCSCEDLTKPSRSRVRIPTG